jgi:hypothetical protein
MAGTGLLRSLAARTGLTVQGRKVQFVASGSSLSPDITEGADSTSGPAANGGQVPRYS